jgi:hypothetical protein
VRGIWKNAARQAATLLLIALIPAGSSAFYHLRVKSWRVPSENTVPLSDVQHWGKRVLWVDARSEMEYAAGHVQGALLLNLDQWNQLLPSLLQVWEPKHPCLRESFANRFVASSLIYWIVHSFPSTS